ncbi:MAG: PKD domain-containing protein [Gammaproteobacteria bacterium]
MSDTSGSTEPAAAPLLGSVQGKTLSVDIDADGSYSIGAVGFKAPILRSDVEADVDFRRLRSSTYPQHKLTRSTFQDEFGSGSTVIVTHTGLAGAPDLKWSVRLYRDQEWGDMQASVVNTTDRTVAIQAIRSVHATEGSVINLNGPASSDRILSDSFSEDRPQLAIRELADAPAGVHRAVGSQLIYNRESGESLFLGALTSDRLLTIFHLKVHRQGVNAQIQSYETVETGTTEILKGESLRKSAPAEQVALSLSVKPGDSLSSERLMFAVGHDYHAQLEHYGRVAGRMHQARVNTPTPLGWWSWTAYYFGLNEGTALTNAQWLRENLKQSGYSYFHIDEGYQYARGEYTTPDVNLFPRGMRYLAREVLRKGLTFGVWTAPFEVSERAWVFQHHKEWLLHNAAGQLIHIGHVLGQDDALYVLDTTHPHAQEYLRQTYATIAHDWGVRYIKMDFMDDTAVEGAYYRPNTTALEAQRIGLQIIRGAVGEDVVLDKDGGAMLLPIGIVDTGRISQDTGHEFGGTRDAASGIAARYYMNRNFYVADPDAFTVSTQTVDDQSWHETRQPLTLDEAKVSISLAAVSGGMYEIGDDLPTLGASAERLALVKNRDLIEMARLGRASIPTDLMTYAPTDKQPSVFLLKENSRQSILTVFNWTDVDLTRSIALGGLGLKDPASYQIVELFSNHGCYSSFVQSIKFVQAAHSVCVLKLIDASVAPLAPAFEVRAASAATAGQTLAFEASASSPEAPVLSYHWEFGDGTSEDGMNVRHVFTRSGDYEVHVTATGLDAVTSTKNVKTAISGSIPTKFVPARKKRPESGVWGEVEQ